MNTLSEARCENAPGGAVARGLAALGRGAAILALGAVFAAFGPALAHASGGSGYGAQGKGAFAPIADDALVIHVGKAHVLNLPRAASDVLISDPEIVDAVLRTASQPVLFGVKIGQANILFFDENNNEIDTIQIRVEHDAAILNRMIRQQYPNARVRAESVLGEIVLTGEVDSSLEAGGIVELAKRFVLNAVASRGDADGVVEIDLASADGVVNRISVLNEEQVHLKVRVAEVNRSVLKRLGVDWNAGLQSSIISSTIAVQGNGALQSLFRGQGTSISVGPQTLDAFIKALEQYTQVRTLAEPSLTAISGEKASFLAGGEFPIPVSSSDGEIRVDFRSFGVGLDFTPIVLGDGRISLHVATEVSDLTDEGSININGLVLPALTVRRADTTVELPSGGTMMIAGLIEQNTRRLSAGLPGLRSLPVLGSFFRSEETEIGETELVVMVTPYEVGASNPQDVSLPTDGFAPASDMDVYLFGRLHAVYGDGAPERSELKGDLSRLAAPVGFMME